MVFTKSKRRALHLETGAAFTRYEMQHSDAALKRLAATHWGRVIGTAQTAPRVSGGLRPDPDPVLDHVGWEVWAFYVRRKGSCRLHCSCCGQPSERMVYRQTRAGWGVITWGRAAACWLDAGEVNERELASEPAPVCAFCLDAPASVYAGEPEEALCVICAKRVELDEAGQ